MSQKLWTRYSFSLSGGSAPGVGGVEKGGGLNKYSGGEGAGRCGQQAKDERREELESSELRQVCDRAGSDQTIEVRRDCGSLGNFAAGLLGNFFSSWNRFHR